jgi:hypothetical protein
MSRKREIQQSEAEEKVKRVKIEEGNWATEQPVVNPSSQTGRFQRDDTNPYGSIPGRRSFGGFNGIVERNYAAAIGKPLPEDKKKSSAAETKEDYASLVSLPRGPNQVRSSSCYTIILFPTTAMLFMCVLFTLFHFRAALPLVHLITGSLIMVIAKTMTNRIKGCRKRSSLNVSEESPCKYCSVNKSNL